MRLLTFGHGTLSREELAALVRQANLSQVVDVRTTPKSSRHPWVWREELERWLKPESGAQYAWAPALGGRRRAAKDSPNVALRHPAFRGYADYMNTAEFRDALRALLDSLNDDRPTAIMCSETLWWRCHRRLIADNAVLLHGVDVQHLDARGKMRPHVPTGGVRRDGDRLVYDAADAA